MDTGEQRGRVGAVDDAVRMRRVAGMSDEENAKAYDEAVGRLQDGLNAPEGEGGDPYDALVATAEEKGFIRYPVPGDGPLVTVAGVELIGVLMSATPPSIRTNVLASLIVAGLEEVTSAVVDMLMGEAGPPAEVTTPPSDN